MNYIFKVGNRYVYFNKYNVSFNKLGEMFDIDPGIFLIREVGQYIYSPIKFDLEEVSFDYLNDIRVYKTNTGYFIAHSGQILDIVPMTKEYCEELVKKIVKFHKKIGYDARIANKRLLNKKDEIITLNQLKERI